MGRAAWDRSRQAQEVKTIGDALMLRTSDAAAAIRLGPCIVHDVGAQHGFPLVRVGMHTGSAVERDGDWFGTTVNLAARVSAAASGVTAASVEKDWRWASRSPRRHDHGQGVHAEGVDMKASAMTGRSPAAVRRLARGLRRIARSGISMAETGAAGARWSWRLTALFTLTVTAAVSVALQPAAATRRNRR